MEETKICPKCKTEIPKGAKVCPNCRSKLGLKKWPFILGAVVLVVIIAAATSNNDTKQTSSNEPAAQTQGSAQTPKPTEKPKLEVIESDMQKENYFTYVVGTVQNNTDKKYSYAQVEINLYDKDGVQVGSTMANVNNLEPNGKWKFKAAVTEKNATSYKIKEVTGW